MGLNRRRRRNIRTGRELIESWFLIQDEMVMMACATCLPFSHLKNHNSSRTNTKTKYMFAIISESTVISDENLKNQLKLIGYP